MEHQRTAEPVERLRLRGRGSLSALTAEVAAGKQPALTAGPVVEAAGPRGPGLVLSEGTREPVVIPGIRPRQIVVTPRADAEPVGLLVDHRRTVETRKTGADPGRLVAILGRSDRRAVPASSEPEAEGEVGRPPVATAEPVERGSLTPRAVAEPGGLPGPVQREQVGILVAVTEAEAVTGPGESVGPVEFREAVAVAAVETLESREVWADVGQSGSGPGEYYSFFIDSAFGIASVTLLHNNPEGSQPPGYLIL